MQTYQLLNEESSFDQVEALHTVLTLNHEGQWSRKYSLLSRSQFKPGPMWSEQNVINENPFYAEIESYTDDELEILMDEIDTYYQENEE